MSRLRNKRVIVTGAASGIGKAIAQRFINEEAYVLFTDLDGEKAKKAAEETGSANAHSHPLDVTKASDFERAIKYIDETWGGLDVMINNAGFGVAAQTHETTQEEWNKVIDICLKGTFLGIKYAIPELKKGNGGAIVNISSVAAIVGVKERAAYCAAKGGVTSLTRAAAADYAGEGIRVNCIAPGTVDTPWVDRIIQRYDDPEKARQAMKERQPHGRLVSPEEVASMAVYLASDEAGSTNGAEMVVDGGWTAQ
ncbi:MAG: SDR family oxidoreductase [Balneolaceae bacterium]|nr:SDR family oxidoreductase [Balneolaceae bacterium]